MCIPVSTYAHSCVCMCVTMHAWRQVHEASRKQNYIPRITVVAISHVGAKN